MKKYSAINFYFIYHISTDFLHHCWLFWWPSCGQLSFLPLTVVFQQKSGYRMNVWGLGTLVHCSPGSWVISNWFERLAYWLEQGFPLGHQLLMRHISILWSKSGENDITGLQVQYLSGVERAEDGDKVGTENSLGKYAHCSENWEKVPVLGFRLLKSETSLKSSACKGEGREFVWDAGLADQKYQYMQDASVN